MSVLVKLPDGRRVVLDNRSNKRRMFGRFGSLGCACSDRPTFKGLGSASQSIIGGASTGASIGQTLIPIPGVGAAVGAVMGAVTGELKNLFGTNKDVRASAGDIAKCQQMLTQYLDTARQAGGPIGAKLGLDQLQQIHWCIMAVKGKIVGNLDPRYFDGEFIMMQDMGKQLAQGIFSNPVGATITLKPADYNVPGRKYPIQSAAWTLSNPGPIPVQKLTTQYFAPAVLQMCKNTSSKGAPGCPELHALPEFKQLMLDIMDYELSVYAPRTPQVQAPIASPIPAPSTAGTSLPSVSLAPTAANVPSQGSPSPDVSGLISQLLSQGASQQQTFQSALSSLSSQGQTITPEVQNAVAQQVSDASGKLPVWVFPAGIGAIVLLFLLKKKRKL